MECISYIAHESSMARMERTNKRLWILVIIVLALLLGTNAGWIYYESQFVTEEVTQEVRTRDGGSAFVAGIGDIEYGGSSTADSTPENTENWR